MLRKWSFALIWMHLLSGIIGPTTATTTTPPVPGGDPSPTTSTTSAPDTTTTTTTTSAPDTTTTTTTTSAPDTTTTTPPRVTTTTTPAPVTTTTTPVPGTPTTTTTAPGTPTTTTAAPGTTAAAASGCNATLTATASLQYFTSTNYPSNYDSNMNCHILITSPADTAITLTFSAFSFEDDTYCTYDYFSVYDYSTADSSTSLIGKFCGTSTPGNIQSNNNGLQVIIYSDGSIQSSGANVGYQYIDNSYPNCKAGYMSYTASATVQTFGTSSSPYQSNQDEYFLVENPGGNLVLQLNAMDIERASGCIYDRLTIYDGGCTRNTVLDIHCGTFLKRWELTGSEYLVHFHSDSSIERNGFTLEFFLGVAGTGAPTTTTTTIGPPVAAQVNLVAEVLVDYNAENFPVRNLSYAVETTVELYLAGVNSFDEVQQKLTTTIQFELRWKDDSMRWPASKQSGITKLLMPQNDLWKPDLALLNSFTSLSAMGSKFMFVVVENNGSCTWKPYQILESTCQADMTDFPYDTQECDLKFSTWSSSSDQVQTIIGSGGMRKHENFVENSEWKLEGISQRSETINGQLTAVFTLKLKRNHSFIVFYVTVPLILLSLLNSLTFALPVLAGEKAGYAITVFLSFLIYVIVTFQKMPDSSDSISLFAIYVLIMTGMSNLAVMISLLEIRMMELKTKHKPMLQCTISFTKKVLNLQHRLLCIKGQMDERRFQAAQEESRNKKVAKEDDDDDDDIEGEDNTWPEFVSALDFVCFWVFFIVSLGLAIGYMVYLATR